jgi:uncharacterized membrane protein YebE (DUF533 family)
MEKIDRKNAANQLKAALNLLWHESIRINKESSHRDVVSYIDMVRIADAIRSDGATILGLESLPESIESGLKFATAALDPNRARAEETLKNGLAGLGGAGGLALAYVCLAQLMNPGLWASLVAMFVGGVAAGPFVIVGITAGLLMAAGAVYTAFQKMSPEERTAKAHLFVMNGIDNWVEYGSQDKPIKKQQVEATIAEDASAYNLSIEDAIAIGTLLLNIANSDGIFTDEERMNIHHFLGKGDLDSRMKTTQALDHIKDLSSGKIAQITDWLFQVAQSDNVFHEKEIETLQRYCQKLGVDFTSYAKKYELRLRKSPD